MGKFRVRGENVGKTVFIPNSGSKATTVTLTADFNDGQIMDLINKGVDISHFEEDATNKNYPSLIELRKASFSISTGKQVRYTKTSLKPYDSVAVAAPIVNNDSKILKLVIGGMEVGRASELIAKDSWTADEIKEIGAVLKITSPTAAKINNKLAA